MVDITVTERLNAALAAFDAENITEPQCHDRVAAVLEAVYQAHIGLITAGEMVAKVERALGGKFELYVEPERAGIAADLFRRADTLRESLSKMTTKTERAAVYVAETAMRVAAENVRDGVEFHDDMPRVSFQSVTAVRRR